MTLETEQDKIREMRECKEANKLPQTPDWHMKAKMRECRVCGHREVCKFLHQYVQAENVKAFTCYYSDLPRDGA